MRAEIVLK